MDDLGFFSVSLQRPPVTNKKDVHSQSIQFKNVNFRASKELKKSVNQKMRLERAEDSSIPKPDRLNHEECLKRIDQYLEKYPILTRADYCRLTGLRKEYALQDLNSFIEQGLLQRFGGGKQVFYTKTKTEL